MTHPKQEKDWEEKWSKEFDEKFCFPPDRIDDKLRGWSNPPPNQREVKSFIHSLLSQAKQEGIDETYKNIDHIKGKWFEAGKQEGREEVIREVEEGLPIKETTKGYLDSSDDYIWGYRDGRDDYKSEVKALLKAKALLLHYNHIKNQL